VQSGFVHFITGLSRGIDFDAALYVLELKKENPGLILECAIPFLAQSDGWFAADKKIYEYIKSKADINTVLQKEYTKNCYQKRNEYMVDNSSLVIAVYGGTQSGTKNCIGYARQCGVKINMIYC